MSAHSEGVKPRNVGISLRDYAALARPGHWFKNVLVLPGAALSALGTRAAGPSSVRDRPVLDVLSEAINNPLRLLLGLLIAITFYACCASFLLGVILLKYRVELLLCLPFLAFGFAWYLHLGMQPNSPAQRPEHLYREWRFVLYLAFVTLLLVAAFLVDLPWLDWTLQPSVRGN